MVYSFHPISGNIVQIKAISIEIADIRTHLPTYNYLNTIILWREYSLLTVTSFALNGRMMI